MDRAETHQGVQMPANIVETLTRHDSAIQTMGGQIKTLQGDVRSGFHNITTSLTNLSSKLDRQVERSIQPAAATMPAKR